MGVVRPRVKQLNKKKLIKFKCQNIVIEINAMIIFRKGLEMFSFSIMESSFGFPNVKIITIPAISLV